MESWLLTSFEAGVRGDTFDRLLDAFPAAAERLDVPTLVDVYRTHRPAIALSDDVASVLTRLRSHGHRIGILSDGPATSQSAKVESLQLGAWCDPIILTDGRGPGFVKPGPAGFEAIARLWDLQAAEMTYVADNPEKDFVGPRRLGWHTVRLRHQRQLRGALEPANDTFRPDVEIGSLDDLLR